MQRRNYPEICAEFIAANEWLAAVGVREQQKRILRNHSREISTVPTIMTPRHHCYINFAGLELRDSETTTWA